jgi:hypothetical protein
VGLGIGCPTLNIDSKSIEMNVLALDHANHLPAQGFDIL